MARTHAISGEVFALRPLGSAIGSETTAAVLKARQLEVVRVVMPAGRELPEHSVAGEITVHVLEGELELAIPEGKRRLGAGDFIHLAGGTPHAVRAVADSSAVLTICLA